MVHIIENLEALEIEKIILNPLRFLKKRGEFDNLSLTQNGFIVLMTKREKLVEKQRLANVKRPLPRFPNFVRGLPDNHFSENAVTVEFDNTVNAFYLFTWKSIFLKFHDIVSISTHK
jgi:hypothetical protein